MTMVYPIALFLLEDLRRARYTLRRYSEASCPLPFGYHNAHSEPVGDWDEDPAKPYTGTRPPAVDDGDPRWPMSCACGYSFAETDKRQVFADGLYRRGEAGEVLTWESAPAGAVREATWWPDKGPDGRAWEIKLPDGSDFMTEQRATNCACPPNNPQHRCWTRTGTAPSFTIQPSIQTPRWHGFIRGGKLVLA